MTRRRIAVFMVAVMVLFLSVPVLASARSAPSGTQEHAGKTLVLRWYEELVNEGKTAVADEIFAPDHVEHAPTLPWFGSGPAQQKELVVALRLAFPDVDVSVEDVVAEGDRVAVRWLLRGTHRGEFWELAPTGETVAVPGTTVYRIANGRIVETWLTYDALGLLAQLGALADSASPATATT